MHSVDYGRRLQNSYFSMVYCNGQKPIYWPTEIVGHFVVDPNRRNWSHWASPRHIRRRQAAPVSGTCPRSEWLARDSRKPPRTRAMNAQELLQEISEYCRHTGLAESTFGRRAGGPLERGDRLVQRQSPPIPGRRAVDEYGQLRCRILESVEKRKR